ncbi:MAG: LacI family DNA-binding transcriptional regulator [Prolixibacteraceae bacterium]|nr:LacI family DNA-binding transcriptional regulator [Prolixibacteraceae bacterium]
MDQKPETTIHDIARKLNISASTVSRALKDNPLISEKTRELIKKTALEMGYRPNIIAASFRTKKTNTIGVIVPLINRHFFSSVISGIEEVAYSEGFTVTISQSNDKYRKEVYITQSLFSNRVDGLILSIGMETLDTSHLKLFSDKNIPLIFFDRPAKDIKAHKIVVDDFKGGYKATRHLVEQGYKRIAHIGGPLNLSIYRDRLEGYLKALEDSGIKADKNLIIHNSLTRDDSTNSINTLMKNSISPDAVFCANDTSALSVIIYIQNSGIKIPEEFGVVGFSNEPFSEVVTPSISTIKQPGFEMGKIAGELLIDQINGKHKQTDFRTIVMPTELIIRNSSKRKSL